MSHVGTIGERRSFDAQLMRIVTGASYFNDQPFRTLRFHTPEGDVLVWRTSTAVTLVEGERYRFTATVKSHRRGVEVCVQPEEWTEITRLASPERMTPSDTPGTPAIVTDD